MIHIGRRRLGVVCGAALAMGAALIGPALASGSASPGSSNWAQPGAGAEHRGSNPSERVIALSNVGKLATAWTSDGVRSSPDVVGGIAYVAPQEDHHVVALDAGTGAPVWSVALDPDEEYPQLSAPAVASGRVFVDDVDGRVWALDAATGATVWSTATSISLLGTPVVAGGVVYLANTSKAASDRVVAISASTGAVLWDKHVRARGVDPSVADGLLFVNTAEGLDARSAATGKLRWTFVGDSYLYAPSIDRQTVLVLSQRGTVYALSASTGAQIWSFATGAGRGTDGAATPAVDHGIVYVGSSAFYPGPRTPLFAIDETSGALRWTGNTNSPVWPIAVANRVLVTTNLYNQLLAFDSRNGKPLLVKRMPEAHFGPVVADGTVYLSSYEGLEALQPPRR